MVAAFDVTKSALCLTTWGGALALAMKGCTHQLTLLEEGKRERARKRKSVCVSNERICGTVMSH